MNPYLFRLLLGLSILCSWAQAAAPQALHDRAELLKLAATPYWHLLLHYDAARTPSGWRSEARTPAFFLSNNGRTNPEGELHALLDALFAADPGGDASAACRFPARTAWLREQLGPGMPPEAVCPAFAEWQAAIRPAQATLVFASDYLNNPSSMFGHTFLRLDASDQTEDTRLLAYAVNFAANADAHNPLSFAWNGLTGGYPGTFSLLPYYDKVREYSDMENRDLWEYQLTLTPVELQRLLQHLWELRGVEFPYYFLTRNCSYQLLSLLEVARPGLNLRKDFPLQAIPTDTVRRVLKEPGMLRKLVYRPSAERRLLADARHNPAAVNHAALTLAATPTATLALDPLAEAAALEAAYDYRYYQFTAGDSGPGSHQALRQLLVRRAALPVPDQRLTPVRPAVDPASGHDTARLGLGIGHAGGENHLDLVVRPAYHDLLDPPGGYRPGAHIDFLDAGLRLRHDHPALQLDHLRLIDIDSLTPRDTFFHPWSWFVGFGQRQAAVDSQGRFSARDSHGVAYVDGGAGTDLALTGSLECYLQLGLDAEAGPALDVGARAGAGPRAGCLYNRDRWRLQLQTDSRYQSDIEGMETRSLLRLQLDMAPGYGLRLEAGRLEHGGAHDNHAGLAWLHYF